MKKFKKTIISLLSATTLLSNTLICTTANAVDGEGSKTLNLTRAQIVSKANNLLNNSYYNHNCTHWCAEYISNLMGFSYEHREEENSRFYSSCTELVIDCIKQNSKSFGTFYRVADNDKMLEDYRGETAIPPNQRNYTPKVGDLVVYNKNDWNYLDKHKYWNYDKSQKESYESFGWDAHVTTDIDHIGLVVAVEGDKISTIEGNYTTNFKLSEFGDDYAAAINRYCNGTNEKATSPVKVGFEDVDYAFIYGFINPNYSGEYKIGDADENGKVDICDLVVVKQYVVRDNVTININNADIDNNGAVDLSDMTSISMYLLEGKWPKIHHRK